MDFEPLKTSGLANRPHSGRKTIFHTSVLPQNLAGQFAEVVDQDVGGRVLKRLGLKSVGHAAGTDLRVAGGEDIDSAIADHDHAFPWNAGFRKSISMPTGRGFSFEAVAAVDAEEMIAQAERGHNMVADADRLVGEHRKSRTWNPETVEGFAHAGIEHGVSRQCSA